MVRMAAQKAEAVEFADQLVGEIERLKARCAELEAIARTERKGAEDVRRQLIAAVERAKAAEVRAGELEARAAELKCVHADLGAERQRADEDLDEHEEVRYGQRCAPPSAGHITARRASGEMRRFHFSEEAENWLDEETSLDSRGRP